jgi:class 3 adenylate cyclase/tetratricopeptide (TPR) repeat protein
MLCSSCGSENRDAARFCDACGHPLAAEPAAAPERSVYTPRHLADKILQSKSALEGERKQVTVLFADVRDSLPLAEQVGPEEWHQILERFFEILTNGVHRFEGTVNQYTGDGIMALFGAPIAHEDHAQRACYTALHLRDALREFTTDVKRRHGADFAVRIGLNSGEVIVGKIGDDLRMDYTAQGHTVGLAQRMEALASGGSVYLSAQTADLVTGYFELEDLGEFQIKGASESLRVFELQGTGSVRTRFDLSRVRGLSRFVGRGDEMARLETALDRALAGPGRTIGVVAQAGTGKSRLCFEFLEGCRARGLSVIEARGLAHGRLIPLLPVLELLRAFFGIDERDSDRVTREKIAGRLLLLDESLRDDLPIFFDLLGVPDPARPLPQLDPEVLQRRMHAAVRAIARADGDLDPGVVLLEDLHWLDPASDAVLEQVVEGFAESRSLVLVNFRPEYRARWMQESFYEQLDLQPLSEDALRELLSEQLGSHESVADLPGAIYARTGGNPFFIEEVVQSLVDEGYLEGERGAYQLVSPVETLPIPENVQAVLAARIDRLPERDKHVLQSASVIGKTFRETVLERVVELPSSELDAALHNLEEGEFLYEAALYPEREYTFKHPLTQEVADHSQLSERRSRAHAAVARAIEELDADQLDERATLLAHHWEHASEPLRASRWHARAAGRLGATDYADSYTHWRRAAELLEGLEEDPEVRTLQVRAIMEQLKSGFRVGLELQEADVLFARGRALLGARGDERQLAELIGAYAPMQQSSGDQRVYLELMREAVATARRSGVREIQAALGLDHVWALMLNGELLEARTASEEAVAIAGDDLQLGSEIYGWSPLVGNLGFGAYNLCLLGEIQEAEERMQRATRLATQDGRFELMTWIASWGSEVAQARGDLEQAYRAAVRSAELADRSGSSFNTILASCWLAQAQLGRGAWREAAELLEAALEAGRRKGMAIDILCMSHWVLPRAYAGLGDLERASALADEGIEMCRAGGVRLGLIRSLLSRAVVAKSEADLDEAEQLVHATSARRFLPEICEVRAQLAEGAERERHLREALRLFQETGATGHADRIARQLD